MFAALLRWVPVLAVGVGWEARAEPREPEELRAVLALVSDASEAEAREREPPPEKPEQVEPTESREPSSLVTLLLSGALEPGKTLVGNRLLATVFSEGVDAKPPWLYRLGGQRVVAILLHNPEGGAPWAPRVVRLSSESLGPQPVTLSAHMRVPQLLPGESVWLVLEWPLDEEEVVFRLEVRDREAGRGMRLVRDGR